MIRMQYTLRSVPPQVDKALRKRAQRTGKSLNTVALEALAKGAGVAPEAATFRDLDWFIGSGAFDSSFDDALEWLDSVPKDLP